MIKRILLIALTLISFNTLANDADLYLGGWSKHFNSSYDYNETNNLIGIEYDNLVVGKFDNSFDETTYIFGYDWNTQWYDIKVGALSGVMYGYTRGRLYDYLYESGSGKRLLPMILPYISYVKYPVQPVIGVMGNAFILTFKIDF